MNIDGKPYRTVWESPEESGVVQIIDQRQLPFELVVEDLRTVEDVAVAITNSFGFGGHNVCLAFRRWEE